MGQGKGHKDWDCHDHKPTKVRLTRHQEDRGPVQTEQVLTTESAARDIRKSRKLASHVSSKVNPSDQQVGIPDQSQD